MQTAGKEGHIQSKGNMPRDDEKGGHMKKYKGWINKTFCYEINAESRGQAYGMLLRQASELLKRGFRIKETELVEERVENKRKREKTEECEGQFKFIV